MAKLLCLFALMAIMQVATCLDCFSCDPNTCPLDQSKWAKAQNCGKTITSGNVGACLKQTYTDKNTNKETVVRRCVIAEKIGDKANYKCLDVQGPTSSCEICQSDYCNSASRVSFSLIAFMGVIVALVVPKYL